MRNPRYPFPLSTIRRLLSTIRYLPAVVSECACPPLVENGRTGSLRKIAKRMVGLPFAISYLLITTPIHAINIGDVFFAGALKNRTIGDFITPLLRAAIIVAGIIAFLLFLVGGVTVIAGAGNPQRQEQGRTAITAGVVGLVLVVSAYWIVQIVETLTGTNLLNPTL